MSVKAAPAEAPAADVLDSPEAGGRAIRGSAIRGVGYAVSTLVTLASAPLLVRHLGVVDFGRYMTVVSLVALVAGVTDVGLASLAIREYTVRSGAERERFMRNVLGTRLLLTFVGGVLATGFALIAGYETDLVVGTMVASAGLLLVIVGHNIGVPLAADLRYGWLTLLDVISKVLGVGLVLALVLASARIVPFLAVPIVPGIGVVVLTAVLVRGRAPFRPSLDLSEIGPLLRETLPLAVATVLTTIYARIVIIIMSLIATGLVTGYFGTASRVLEVAVGIPLVLVSTMLPILARAARDDRDRLRYALQRLLEVALIGGVWMAMSMSLCAGFVIELIGGSEVAPAALPLRILALALVPVFLNVTWQHALLSLRQHNELFVANAIGLIMIVPLTFLLTPRLGAEGAAIALVVSECCLTVTSAFGLIRKHSELRPQLRLVHRVLVAAGLALAATLLADMHELVRVLLATSVYFGVLAALGAIPAEVATAVNARLRDARTAAAAEEGTRSGR